MLTKKAIENEIIKYVLKYDKRGPLTEKWRKPLVGFADANHPDFNKLKELVHPDHEIPRDIIPDARTVIAYFVPFTCKISKGNECDGLSSPEWALAYEETNAMFLKLNKYMISFLNDHACHAAVSKEASVFDREKIISRWSQRHIARLAGLGTFGLNNMLITDAGCCGRIHTIVTDLDVEPDQPPTEENCLYKRKGTCGVCINRCPVGALKEEGFDRKKCYARCMENAKVYTEFGNSYAAKTGEEIENSGSEVCGKCLTSLPCTLKKP